MRTHLLVLLVVCVTSIGQAFSDENPLNPPLSLLPAAPFISGAKVSKSLLAGKPVVVTFFASWCPPCRPEFATLNKLKDHPAAKGVNIIAVNVFEDAFGKKPARLKRFLKLTNPQYPVSPEMRTAFGNVTRIPTLVVYDSQGRESWRFVHEVGATKMTAELDEIVAALRVVAK